MIWKEKRLKPKIETTKVKDGYENICETCEDWGEKCESCNVSVPVETEFEEVEVTMAQFSIYGIPTGSPYEIK